LDRTLKAPDVSKARNPSATHLPLSAMAISSQTNQPPDAEDFPDPTNPSEAKATFTRDINEGPVRNIQIPGLDPPSEAVKFPSTSPITNNTAVVNSPPFPARVHVNRQRSRSNAEAPEHRPHDRDLASPAAFRFPLKPKATIANNQTGEGSTLHSHYKPPEAGTSGSHQTAHSVDTISRRAGVQQPVPPSMYRARSATAVQQVHGRYDSKASDVIDESTVESPKPPVRLVSDRNGSEASLVSNHSLGTPGLKDVLKVGQTNAYHSFV
jgi:hypothetical protein